MTETELDNWRRTHYSNELISSTNEMDVIVMGWVSSVRGHGNISFVTIEDMTGQIQIVSKKGDCPDQILEKISKLKEHTCIGIKGRIKKSEKAPNGIEVIPNDLRIFSDVKIIPPFDPNAKTVKNIDTRLEIRAVDLRRNTLKKVFIARNEVLKSIRNYFTRQNFIEINTPKMIATATEGGAALFP